MGHPMGRVAAAAEVDREGGMSPTLDRLSRPVEDAAGWRRPRLAQRCRRSFRNSRSSLLPGAAAPDLPGRRGSGGLRSGRARNGWSLVIREGVWSVGGCWHAARPGMSVAAPMVMQEFEDQEVANGRKQVRQRPGDRSAYRHRWEVAREDCPGEGCSRPRKSSACWQADQFPLRCGA